MANSPKQRSAREMANLDHVFGKSHVKLGPARPSATLCCLQLCSTPVLFSPARLAIVISKNAVNAPTYFHI